MFKTFNGPFRQLQNQPQDNFPKNIASAYATFSNGFYSQKVQNKVKNAKP
jgi:hypothetical protein